MAWSAPFKTKSGPLSPVLSTDFPEILACLESICRRYHIVSLFPRISSCAETVDNHNLVDVAVLGRFNSGKSSLLNGILRRDLLPVGVLPLTSVVTRLQFGSTDRGVVRFRNGDELRIPVTDLAEYVTEELNPANVKGVEIVDLEVSGSRDFEGIRFVDTPGVGSLFGHNTQASEDWLPRVGVALLALSVDQPLSKDDMDLLENLTNHTPHVAIIVTKVDLVEAEERARVTRFVQQQVHRIHDQGVEIFQYSTRPGFESLRKALRDRLAREVSQRHEKMAREIARFKLAQLTTACRGYLQLALAASSARREALLELTGQVERERHGLTTADNEIRLIARDLKDRARREFLDGFLRYHAGLLATLVKDLHPKTTAWRGNLRVTTEHFEQWAKDSLMSRLRPISVEVSEELIPRFQVAAGTAFSRVVEAFQSRLSGYVEQALQTSFVGANFEANPISPQDPDIQVGRVFEIPFDLIWFLIPMPLVRRWVHRHFFRRLRWEVEKNLHRLAGQWTEVLAGSIDDLANQAQRFVQNELDTVTGLASSATDQRPEIEEALSTLDQLGAELSGESLTPAVNMKRKEIAK